MQEDAVVSLRQRPMSWCFVVSGSGAPWSSHGSRDRTFAGIEKIFTFFILILGLGVIAVPSGLLASALPSLGKKKE